MHTHQSEGVGITVQIGPLNSNTTPAGADLAVTGFEPWAVGALFGLLLAGAALKLLAGKTKKV